MAHCVRHYEEPVDGHCRACHQPFCERCLVFSFGPKKPPYCVACALSASGVRHGAKVPVYLASEAELAAPVPDKRLERAQRRAERTAAKAKAKADIRVKAGRRRGKVDPPTVSIEDDIDAQKRPSFVPAPTTLSARSVHPV